MRGDPIVAQVVVGAVLFFGGLAILAFARMSAAGTLRRNWIAGVRTPLTMSSDAAWYAAQKGAASAERIAGWGWMSAGLVLLVAMALAGLMAWPGAVVAAVGVPIIAVGVVWALVWLFIALARGLRAARAVVR